MRALAARPRFRAVCADLLRAGHAVRFVATGNSMAPTIHDGDALTVEPIAARQARTGDIVVYLPSRGLTAHRVLGFDEPSLLRCRGDAPGSEEELVPADQVLGRVEKIEHAALAGPARGSGARRLLKPLSATVRVFLQWLRTENGRDCPSCHQSGRSGR